jgi:hypothetical protein
VEDLQIIKGIGSNMSARMHLLRLAKGNLTPTLLVGEFGKNMTKSMLDQMDFSKNDMLVDRDSAFQHSDCLLCLFIEDWRKTIALKWKRMRQMTCHIDPMAIERNIDPMAIERNIVNDITGKRREKPNPDITYPLMKAV